MNEVFSVVLSGEPNLDRCELCGEHYYYLRTATVTTPNGGDTSFTYCTTCCHKLKGVLDLVLLNAYQA